MKRLAKRAVLLAGFAAASASAEAQMSYPAEAWWDNRWYVAPYAQFTFSDTARLAKDGAGFGLAVGKAFAPSWDIELRGAYEELPKQGAPDNWHNWTGEVDGKWYFLGREGVARWDGLQPYAIAGLGLIYDSVGTSKTSFMASAGLGVALPLATLGTLLHRRPLPLGWQQRQARQPEFLRRLGAERRRGDSVRCCTGRHRAGRRQGATRSATSTTSTAGSRRDPGSAAATAAARGQTADDYADLRNLGRRDVSLRQSGADSCRRVSHREHDRGVASGGRYRADQHHDHRPHRSAGFTGQQPAAFGRTRNGGSQLPRRPRPSGEHHQDRGPRRVAIERSPRRSAAPAAGRRHAAN